MVRPKRSSATAGTRTARVIFDDDNAHRYYDGLQTWGLMLNQLVWAIACETNTEVRKVCVFRTVTSVPRLAINHQEAERRFCQHGGSPFPGRRYSYKPQSILEEAWSARETYDVLIVVSRRLVFARAAVDIRQGRWTSFLPDAEEHPSHAREVVLVTERPILRSTRWPRELDDRPELWMSLAAMTAKAVQLQRCGRAAAMSACLLGV